MQEAPAKTVVVVVGPTAVGKTAAALTLAAHFNTSIVSADSRQCYREMTIGTAKPTADELAQAKHYFIDAFSITDQVTAAQYERLALGYVAEIFQQADVAVVCGGTGLYVKALCEGLDEMPEVGAELTQKVEEAFAQNGLIWLQQQIMEHDPLFAAKGEMENPARLMRALSFAMATGQSILNYRTGVAKDRPFRIIKVGLQMPRELLYERINERVLTMMNDGLLAEVEQLYPYKHLKCLQTVGYAELFGYLDGESSLADAVTKIQQHTRNYAKRQLTWFKKDAHVNWLNPLEDPILPFVAALMSRNS